MDDPPHTLGNEGLRRFDSLRLEAIASVSASFHGEHRALYAGFGEKALEVCQTDIGHYLDFLRPVLEFGSVEPMVRVLVWTASMLAAREIPNGHLAGSLDHMAAFFNDHADAAEASVVAAALSAVKADFIAADLAAPTRFPGLPSAWADCGLLETALLEGDRTVAALILRRNLVGDLTLSDVERHLIQPVLYRIGQLWQFNRVSIAREHMATALAQALVEEGFSRAEKEPRNGKKAMLACVEGNHHLLGLRMVANALEIAGWEVHFLGGDLPSPAILGHVIDWKPDLVALSLSMPAQFRIAKALIKSFDRRWGIGRPPILIGGLAVNTYPVMALQIGADGWCADVGAVVALADRLTAARAVH